MGGAGNCTPTHSAETKLDPLEEVFSQPTLPALITPGHDKVNPGKSQIPAFPYPKQSPSSQDPLVRPCPFSGDLRKKILIDYPD